MDMKGRVLVVAGSDSGGGAGIQADIKTITALNGFAMTAITALTAQNSLGVKGVHKPPPAFVTDQIRVTLEDLGADAVKTGMMADAPIIEAAAEALEEHAGGVPWIVDPVMFSSARDLLLDEDAAEALKARLVSRAALVTPNMAEAEALIGRPVATVADLVEMMAAVQEVHVSDVFQKHTVEVVRRTRRHPSIEIGGSPRAGLAMIQAARARAFIHDRDYVVPEDLYALAEDVLLHRIRLKYEALAEGVSSVSVLKEILSEAG